MKKQDKTPTSRRATSRKATSKQAGGGRLTTARRKGAFLRALDESLGIISTACRAAKISRTTFYTWLRNDPEFAECVREIEERQIDEVEGALLSRIREADTTAIIFYLKTKGKTRGFSERLELTGRDGTDLLPPRVLTEEEAKRLFGELEKDC